MALRHMRLLVVLLRLPVWPVAVRDVVIFPRRLVVRLSRRGVRMALAGLPGRCEMAVVADGAAARRVVPPPECSARREARLLRARLLDGGPTYGRLDFGLCRRRRCGRRRRAGARVGRRLLTAGRGLVRRVPGGLRDGAGDSLWRVADGRGPGGTRLVGLLGGRLRCLRRVVGVSRGSRLRDDHPLRRRRARPRARAAELREPHASGVCEQRRRAHAEQQRDEHGGRSASSYPDRTASAAFAGRQRPVPPSDLLPRPRPEYKKRRRGATPVRGRLSLFPRFSLRSLRALGELVAAAPELLGALVVAECLVRVARVAKGPPGAIVEAVRKGFLHRPLRGGQ